MHRSSSLHVGGLQATECFSVCLKSLELGVERHDAFFEDREIVVACCQQSLSILNPVGSILVLFAVATATWLEYLILYDMIFITKWDRSGQNVDRTFSYRTTRVTAWVGGVPVVTHVVQLRVRDEYGKHLVMDDVLEEKCALTGEGASGQDEESDGDSDGKSDVK